MISCVTYNASIYYLFDHSMKYGNGILICIGLIFLCLYSPYVILYNIGSPPLVDRYNFFPYILEYEGSNLTLINTMSSDLPLSSIKWVGFHRPLPSTAVVDNYTTDGVLYSRLSLYELSFEDDSGNYTNIVSNQCGTSSVSVYIDVKKGKVLMCCFKVVNFYACPSAPPVCSNPGSVVAPQKMVMTVKGESIVLRCIAKGNLEVLKLSLQSYWKIPARKISEKDIYISDNSTELYRIAQYQINDCEFINSLIILNATLELDNLNLSCIEMVDTSQYSKSIHLSKYD